MDSMVSIILAQKKKIDYCLKVAIDIDADSLNRRMWKVVYECFKSLEPLSFRLKTIESKDYRDIKVVVGKWFKYRYWFGSPHPVKDAEVLFDIIREFGERMKPLVREEISSEFSSLVDLTLKLKSYKKITFKIDIPRTTVYKCTLKGEVEVEPVKVDSLEISTDNPLMISFLRDGGMVEKGDLTDVRILPMTEGIIDYVVQLYRKAEEGVSKIIEHNNGILEEMERISAPFKIAAEVHR